MSDFWSFARSTAQQVSQWWEGDSRPADRPPLIQRVSDGLQQLRQELDSVILTRLPQFRDVVEDSPDPADDVGSSAESALPVPCSPDPSEAEVIGERRREAERVIDACAWLAAANAFNPILGLDLKVDLEILASMTRSLGEAYGLSEEQLQELQARWEDRHSVSHSIIPHIARRLAPHAACRATTLAFRRLGMDLLAREAAKWVPIVGSAVAASTGYYLFSRVGEQLRKECEDAARDAITGTVSPLLPGPTADPT